MRVSDRIHLRELHGRIRDWLSSVEEDLIGGRRLVQDAVGFATLLREVNSRAELVRHDRDLLSRMEERLASLEPGSANVQLVRSQLAAVIGHSDDLDQLLEGAFDEGRVRSILPQLRAEMERRYGHEGKYSE